MKKIPFVLCLLCLLGEPIHAQSLKDLFLKMPQEVCPSLSEYNRLELVDNQKNDKPMQTRNHFRTLSHMEALTDTYAHLIVSTSSEKELKLLTLQDSSRIIMVVSTIRCDSIPDSSVCFYDTDWQPLDTHSHISLPHTESFRHITIDPSSDRLTITTQDPLRIRTDGSDKPLEPQVATHTFRWQAEENRFVQDE